MRLPPRVSRHITRRIENVSRNPQNTTQCFKCVCNTKDGSGGGNIAVLIDADNAQSRNLTPLLTEVSKYGTANVRRIYGDFTLPHMRSWQECILQNSIVPIQQFAHIAGKNATDGAMMVDAMDLLYTGRFSGFALVTSDSDFARLASRIREQGVTVLGFGNTKNTHRAFIAACNKFIYLDSLAVSSDEERIQSAPVASTPSPWRQVSSTSSLNSAITTSTGHYTDPPTQIEHRNEGYALSPRPLMRPLDRAVLDGMRAVITDIALKKNHIQLSLMGIRLVELSPGFHYSNYGYSQLSTFVMASGLVCLYKEGNLMCVRLKDMRQVTTSGSNSPTSMTTTLTSAKPLIHLQPPSGTQNENENQAPTPTSTVQNSEASTPLDAKPLDHAAVEGIRKAINNLPGGEDSFVDLNKVHGYLMKHSPDLHFANYGYSRLPNFVLASGIVELEYFDEASWVRLKDRHSPLTATGLPTPELITSRGEENTIPTTRVRRTIDQAAIEGIRTAIINNLLPNGDPFVKLGHVGISLVELSPNFHYENYGYSKLGEFVLASGIVELKTTKGSVVWIKLKGEFQTPRTLEFDPAIREGIRDAIISHPKWKPCLPINLSWVVNYLRELFPGMTPRKYGYIYSPMTDLVRASGIVKLKTVGTQVYVVLKDEHCPETSVGFEVDHGNRQKTPLSSVNLEDVHEHKDPTSLAPVCLEEDEHDRRHEGMPPKSKQEESAPEASPKSALPTILLPPPPSEKQNENQAPAPKSSTKFPSMLGLRRSIPIDNATLERIRKTITDLAQEREETDSFAPLNLVVERLTASSPGYTNYSAMKTLIQMSGLVESKTVRSEKFVRLKDPTTTTTTTATKGVPPAPPTNKKPFDSATLEAIRKAILKSSQDNDARESFVPLSDVGKNLEKDSPEITLTDYGYYQLYDWVLASKLVEMRVRDSVPFVRLKESAVLKYRTEKNGVRYYWSGGNGKRGCEMRLALKEEHGNEQETSSSASSAVAPSEKDHAMQELESWAPLLPKYRPEYDEQEILSAAAKSGLAR